MEIMHPKTLVKRLGRQLARPVSRSAKWRVQNLIAEQLADDVSPRLAAAEATRQQLEEVQRYVPILLNTISSQNAAARDHERRIRKIETELEISDAPIDAEQRIAHIEGRLGDADT